MIELLQNLDYLKNADIDYDQISLAGIEFGSCATDIPVDLVIDVTLAPIIKGYSYTQKDGPKYFDENERELPKETVIENAIAEDGVLHFKDKISFFIKNGVVSEFSLYGPQRSFFSYIKSLDQLQKEFGDPDILESKDAYGDLFNSTLYYKKTKKLVDWNHWNNEVTVVLLGRENHV